MGHFPVERWSIRHLFHQRRAGWAIVGQADSQRLQAALNRDQAAFNAATVSRTCQVLIERKGKLPGQMLGKSPWLQSVHLITDAKVGDLVEVEIVSAGPNSLAGIERVRVAA